jgi:hypothetical protein
MKSVATLFAEIGLEMAFTIVFQFNSERISLLFFSDMSMVSASLDFL